MVVVAVAALAILYYVGRHPSKEEREVLTQTEALMKIGKHREAFTLLNEAIKGHPQSLPLKRQRVVICLKADNPEWAFVSYKELLLKSESVAASKQPGKRKEPEFRKRDPILVECLADPDPVVRACAAKVLSSVKDDAAVAPLAKALRDSETNVRRAAANALGELRARKAVQPLMASLSDESWFVRGEAAQALGKIGDSQAIPNLVKLLDEKDSYVRGNATDALRALVVDDKSRAIFAQALASELGADGKKGSGDQVLIGLLGSPDDKVRRKAIWGLAVCKSPGAVPEIRKLVLEGSTLADQCLAALALGTYGDTNNLELLVSILKDTSKPRELRGAAQASCQEILRQNPDFKIDPKTAP